MVTRDRRKRIFPRSVNKQRIKTPKVQSQIFNYNHSLFTQKFKIDQKNGRKTIYNIELKKKSKKVFGHGLGLNP